MDGQIHEQITIGPAARILDVSTSTLRYWEAIGRLTPTRAGALRLYDKAEIERLAQKREMQGELTTT